jgi:hypothetical protein
MLRPVETLAPPVDGRQYGFLLSIDRSSRVVFRVCARQRRLHSDLPRCLLFVLSFRVSPFGQVFGGCFVGRGQVPRAVVFAGRNGRALTRRFNSGLLSDDDVLCCVACGCSGVLARRLD